MSDSKNSNPVVGTITFGPNGGKAETVTEYDPSMPSIDVPSIMRAAGYDEGFAAGVEAAAKLMEENAAEWRKHKGSQPDIAWQLDSEARHIRELLKVQR